MGMRLLQLTNRNGLESQIIRGGEDVADASGFSKQRNACFDVVEVAEDADLDVVLFEDLRCSRGAHVGADGGIVSHCDLYLGVFSHLLETQF